MAFQRTAAPGDDTGSTSDDNVCGSDASKANIPADRPFGFHLKMNVQILLTGGLNSNVDPHFPRLSFGVQ